MSASPHRWSTHIDGLRALAVLSVLAFHLNASWLPGGFVGVDVFFVISGFLISRVVYEDIAANGRFDVIRFYEARARRILPVFTVVTLATLALGYVFYLPPEFERLATSALYSTGFAANVYFYLQSDYFAPAAALQPLLHYWSLGVEEQFYIAFPLVALVAWKLAPKALPVIVTALALASLAAAEWSVRQEPSAAFYLPHLRAWELLIGSIIALPRFPFLRSRAVTEPAALLGLALIIFAAVSYTEEMRFPGIAAAAPIVGAALIIWSCKTSETFVGRLLSLRPARLIGLWSYSVYMIHWPLIVFAAYLWPGHGAGLSAVIGAATLTLGWLSYTFVEQPFRGSQKMLGTRRLYAAAASALAVVAALSLSIQSSAGFPGRLPSDVRAMMGATSYPGLFEEYRVRTCFLQPEQTWDDLDKEACLGDADNSVLLWGDSHAADLFAPLNDHFNQRGVVLYQATYSACLPLIGFVIAERPMCQSFNDATLSWINDARPSAVILSASWGIDEERALMLDATIAKLRSMSIAVIIIGDAPKYDRPVPTIIANRMMRGDANNLAGDHFLDSMTSSDALLGHRYDGDPGVAYISMGETLCQRAACPMLAPDGLPVHWDGEHFTISGGRLAVERMAPQLDAAVALSIQAQ